MKNKLLNRFIGTLDDRDEYQKQEIYKELAFSGALLWSLSMLVMFVNLLIDTVNNTLSFATPALFTVNMVYAVYLMTKLRKKRLDDTDCSSIEEYEEKKKQLKKSSIIAGAFWGIIMLILMQYIFPYLATGEIDISWKNVITWMIAAGFFGTTLYWFSKSKLQKEF